jgi:putative ABC transport system substrate-binding protein
VAKGVDLIMANATPALQAVANATMTIPILGTSVTEYGVALGIDNFNGTVGGNISGTSDLAPLEDQANLLVELLPEAKTVGILYCSAEANSKYQSDTIKALLEGKGLTVVVKTFTDSNDIAAVLNSMVDDVDALYLPTDNVVASNATIIANICGPAKLPVFAGEEGVCKVAGFATLSISYYELGKKTGKMAADILLGKANISNMPISYDPNPMKKYVKFICEDLGIEIPADFVEIVID